MFVGGPSFFDVETSPPRLLSNLIAATSLYPLFWIITSILPDGIFAGAGDSPELCAVIFTSILPPANTVISSESPTVTEQGHSTFPDSRLDLAISSRMQLLNNNSNRHSSSISGADQCFSTQSSVSPSHPSSFTNNSTSSQRHSPQQHHSAMSTLSLAEAGPPSSSQNPVAAQDTPMARHVAFVPRSALDDAAQSSHASKPFDPDSVFDLRERHGYNSEVSSHEQSMLLMGCTENGEVNNLVAHFDSSTDGATIADIPQSRYLLASGLDADSTPGNSVQTVQVLAQEQTGTDDYDEERRHSPRKPIPAQWFPKCNGPNLATAQRAKERSQKKGLHNSSPVEVKTIRGTRSSLDIGHKTTTPEAASFLTKEALAAVDNDITAPTSPPSQNKAKRSPIKSTRNSPNVSPLRSSPRQHAFTSKISPSKTTFLSTSSALVPHLGISHSATTSVSGASFYTAEGSPVRSYANSELSFQSATESFENDGILYHNVNADSEKVQAAQVHKEIQPPLSITTVEGKRSPTRPKLTLTIPDIDLTNANENSASPLTACSNSSTTSVRARNMSAATQSSRIPRATAVTRGESARGPTRSSISKRVQPVESPNSKDKSDAHRNQASTRSNPSKSNTGSIPLPSSTVDSSGMTLVLSFVSLSRALEMGLLYSLMIPL